MNIADVCAKLAAIEEGLTVEVDGLGEFKVVRAYQFMPDIGSLETPCFMHTWRLAEVKLANGTSNGYRQQHYTVGIQAFIEKTTAGSASWSRVATAFHHAFLDALAANVKLEDGDVQLNSLRSGTEAGTLTRLEWNEIAYVGLDYEVDVIIDGVTLVGP